MKSGQAKLTVTCQAVEVKILPLADSVDKDCESKILCNDHDSVGRTVRLVKRTRTMLAIAGRGNEFHAIPDWNLPNRSPEKRRNQNS